MNCAWVPGLLVTCLLAGPAAAEDFIPYSVTAHPSQDGRCRSDTGKADLDRAEKACLAELSGIATRQAKTLRLKLQNGGTKVYSDKSEGCDNGTGACTKYKLTGYFAKDGLLLIEIDHYEGADWRLVWLASGQESKIVAPPHYSPDGKWLAAACWSDGPSGCDNGIDILPTIPDQTRHEWHYRVPDAEYLMFEFVGWDGNDKVNLTATFHAGGESGELKTTPASVERINGPWQLKLPDEYRPQ
jgi:hypothetical protein